jgi:di/tricarboxylate transporter
MALTKRDVWLCVFLVTVFLLVLGFSTYQHELVHKTIGLEFGANYCYITANWHGAMTVCDWDQDKINTTDYKTMQELNIMNEIFGYNMQSVMIILFGISLWFGIIMISGQKEKKIDLNVIKQSEYLTELENEQKRKGL